MQNVSLKLHYQNVRSNVAFRLLFESLCYVMLYSETNDADYFKKPRTETLLLYYYFNISFQTISSNITLTTEIDFSRNRLEASC